MIIVKKYILATLKDLDRRYNTSLTSSSPTESVYYSKLAILDYCGWLEDSMDLIIKRSVNNKLKTQTFRQILKDRVIGNNFGFQYKENFRPMLIQAVGLQKAEKIHEILNSTGKLLIFENELSSVKQFRNDAAHTWLSGTTMTYPAPSLIIGKLNTTYPILRLIYSEVCKF